MKQRYDHYRMTHDKDYENYVMEAMRIHDRKQEYYASGWYGWIMGISFVIWFISLFLGAFLTVHFDWPDKWVLMVNVPSGTVMGLMVFWACADINS